MTLLIRAQQDQREDERDCERQSQTQTQLQPMVHPVIVLVGAKPVNPRLYQC
ncbi:MAG: hypothetical protein KC431_13425 [Myxococcales bacterium]|nr:hypothetical protein [Myxococcales bacterium]